MTKILSIREKKILLSEKKQVLLLLTTCLTQNKLYLKENRHMILQHLGYIKKN
jgi:hypothetical protein